MRLRAVLPEARYTEGKFWVEDARGTTILGPVRARGEADNTGATRHGNPEELPTRLFGDHPGGTYRVLSVEHKDPDHYGPAFLLLLPLDGEALEAQLHGRAGLGIHGGRLHADGRLRETYGCLRLDNAPMERLADLVQAELDRHRPVFYVCEVEETRPDPPRSGSGAATGSTRDD